MHGLLNDVGHFQETAATFEEGAVHDLVGSIDNARHITALSQTLIGEGETAETFGVGTLERQVVHRIPVETVKRTLQTLWERECQLNRHAHIGHAELRLHSSVGKLDG